MLMHINYSLITIHCLITIYTSILNEDGTLCEYISMINLDLKRIIFYSNCKLIYCYITKYI